MRSVALLARRARRFAGGTYGKVILTGGALAAAVSPALATDITLETTLPDSGLSTTIAFKMFKDNIAVPLCGVIVAFMLIGIFVLIIKGLRRTEGKVIRG